MSMLPDFESVAPVPPALIQRYRGRVPEELIALWQAQGFGSSTQGYFKVIDPDKYLERLEGSLPRGLIPVFATALADMFVLDGENLTLLCYRQHRAYGFGPMIRHLDKLLADDECLTEDFHWEPYPEAAAVYGQPAYDECFGYVPLLALGGPNRVEHLEKVKLIEHVNIITQLTGTNPV